MKSNKKIMGLDLSLTCTGWSLGTKETTGSIPTNKLKLEEIDRMIYIKNQIKNLVIENNPNEIVLEGFSFGSRGQGVFQTGGLGWIIRVLLREMSKDFKIITPTELKKFITGKGNAKKELMLMKIYKKWGIEFEDDNEADAFALVKYAEKYFN